MPLRHLSKLMKERAAFQTDAASLEAAFKERYTADLSLDYLSLRSGEQHQVAQSGWGSLYFVLEGSCKLSVTRGPGADLGQGDCGGIPNGRAHTVVAGKSGVILFRTRVSNNAQLLPGFLPPAIFLSAEEVEATECLAELLALLRQLEPATDPIRHLMKCRLADVIAMTLLNHVMAQLDAPIEELLEQGFDGRIKAVITAIHRNPGQDWTVASLATEANLSRSAFAERFHRVVGEPPMHYVARIRINLASSYLQSLDWSVTDIAREVGYQSEGAFINAFSRAMNISPGKFRRNARIQNQVHKSTEASS